MNRALRFTLLGLVVVVLFAVGCGAGEGRPAQQTELAAQQLMPQLSDLPDGFNLNLAESFPVPMSKILNDPWSPGSAAIIRRERISGYQSAFTSPQAVNILCNAAVYRSRAGARKVYRLRTTGGAAFIAELGGRSLPVAEIGEKTVAHRFDIGPNQYVGVAWRFRNVLSTCGAADFTTSPMAVLLVVARAQQARIASALSLP